MAKKNKKIFPFGEKTFIGIIKFFDSNKGFGYVASNNFGMESNKSFSESGQEFYIDEYSILTPIFQKGIVVFRPAINNSKLRAECVRPINLETDRGLVLDYCEHNNIISFEEKVKKYSACGHGHWHFDGYSNERREFSILRLSGMHRYELLKEYSEHFTETHDFDYLLERIDKIIQTTDGEIAYNKQLQRSYIDKDKEYASWKEIISQLSEEQIFNLIKIHPSLQLFVPDELLLRRIELIDEKWGISNAVKKALCDLEESKKLKEVENLIDQNLHGKSRNEIEDIRRIYGGKLSLSRLLIITQRIDELILSEIKDILKEIPCDNCSVFIKDANRMDSEYEQLSERGVLVFRNEISYEYEQKILSLVENFSKLEWYDIKKRKVKDFILSDKIIQEEGFVVPKKSFIEAILKDYDNLFVQSDDVKNQFNRHAAFEEEYACLFNSNEHKEVLAHIENKCLKEGGLFSIARLFSYLGKKLPANIKAKYLNLPINEIVSNISIMEMFEDSGYSILGTIIDKICENNEFFFHRTEQSIDCFGDSIYEEPKNIDFVKKLVSIFGQSYVEQHFIRLKKEDRLDLFVEMQLNIVSKEELKEFLLNAPNAYFHNILTTPIAKDVIMSIITDSDCSTKNGIYDASLWLNRYIGEEPEDKEDRVEWAERRKTIIDSISRSTNEYLKVLVWALYFQSGGDIKLLKNVFCLYQTTLQIRIVKKLFNAMAKKKFPASLEKLKETIGGDIHRLSLPIEIVLKYLSLNNGSDKKEMTDVVMMSILHGREDYDDWFMINQMLNPCNGRRYISNDDKGTNDAFLYFNGTIKKCYVLGKEVYRFLLSRKKLTINEKVTQYNNNLYESIKEYISISYTANDFNIYQSGENLIYDFCTSKERELRIMADNYRIKMENVDYNNKYEIDNNAERFCCECRVSNRLDKNTDKVFLWCRNRPCFNRISHFHTSLEWENYTVLDFMRILSMRTDYTDKNGVITQHGLYTIFSAYMLSFYDLFEHLKCRKCGKLMTENNLSNFARSSLTEFKCTNPDCECHDQIVYLNKCFNPKCKSIIDSRDSKKCPNNSYICVKCGACCSTAKFSERYESLKKTGGYISQRLENAIRLRIGHWEKNEIYCSSCGNKMNGSTCSCGKTYELRR